MRVVALAIPKRALERLARDILCVGPLSDAVSDVGVDAADERPRVCKRIDPHKAVPLAVIAVPPACTATLKMAALARASLRACGRCQTDRRVGQLSHLPHGRNTGPGRQPIRRLRNEPLRVIRWVGVGKVGPGAFAYAEPPGVAGLVSGSPVHWRRHREMPRRAGHPLATVRRMPSTLRRIRSEAGRGSVKRDDSRCMRRPRDGRAPLVAVSGLVRLAHDT